MLKCTTSMPRLQNPERHKKCRALESRYPHKQNALTSVAENPKV